MANEQNLRPRRQLSKEEAKKMGSKGGKASVAARRRKKAMRETMSEVLSMAMQNGDITDIEDIKSMADLKGKNVTVQDVIILAQVKKALKGDTRAAEYIRDMVDDGSTDNNIEIVVTRKGE